MCRIAKSRTCRVAEEIVVCGSLVALVVLFYWRIALAGRVLASGDVFTYFYPYWAEATRAAQSGRLPLWNPYLFTGVPFLANSQSGIFYPLNWPLWLTLPAHISVHATIVLHICLAALNAYLWGRSSLRQSRAGAWATAAAFALGGFLAAHVEHVNQIQALAWLPLLFLLFDRAAGVHSTDRGAISASALPGLVAVTSLVLLAGHTQAAFICLVGLAVYGLAPDVVAAWSSRDLRALRERASVFLVATATATAVAGVQLVPTWELSRFSVRSQGLPLADRVSFSLSPFYIARALLPPYARNVSPAHIEHVAYVGVGGLVLAAGAAWGAGPRRLRHRRVHSVAILGLLLALGMYNPIYLLLARFVPGFAHFRVPARWLALSAIGVAGLVGWGIDAASSSRRVLSKCPVTVVGILFAGLILWGALGPRLSEGDRVQILSVLGWVAGALAVLALLAVGRITPRLARGGFLGLLLVELYLGSSGLPQWRATAPQAFTSLRPAGAHLLAIGQRETAPASRFLSLSDMTFDPGDLGEMQIVFGPQFSEGAFYDLVIAAKQQEVLSPNLPLALGIPAVDGYDGGVLPLQSYVDAQSLLLPPGKVSLDGRLRESLSSVPDGRWLDLFNVRHVITDKLGDAWVDDVFYDLEFGASLGEQEVVSVPSIEVFEATALGFVYDLEDLASVASSSEVIGRVEIGFAGGSSCMFRLVSAGSTAVPEADSGASLGCVRTAQLRATLGSPGQAQAVRLRWEDPTIVESVEFHAERAGVRMLVRGVSLIDERTGSFQPLVISDIGRFKLAHSGDVKIYENLDFLPRAFIVHDGQFQCDVDAAFGLMQRESFDPSSEVVLCDPSGLKRSNGLVSDPEKPSARPQMLSSARFRSYTAERIEIEAESDAPGYLVLTDAWYPGWTVTVDEKPSTVLRADHLFRAVSLPAGRYAVEFVFRPASLRTGIWMTLVGLVVLGGWVARALRRMRPRGMA
jgi:hypothetical protein